MARIRNPLQWLNDFFAVHPAICVTIGIALGGTSVASVDRLLLHEKRHTFDEARLEALEQIATTRVADHTRYDEAIPRLTVALGELKAVVSAQFEADKQRNELHQKSIDLLTQLVMEQRGEIARRHPPAVAER